MHKNMTSAAALLEAVEFNIDSDMVQSALSCCGSQLSTSELCGDAEHKPGFVSYVTLLTIHKDLNAVGYDKLHTVITAQYGLSKESIVHNVKTVYHVLASWACDHIFVQQQYILQQAGNPVMVTKVPNSDAAGKVIVHIWMDSTDICTTGKCNTSPKDPNWSYKCNRPG